MKQELSPHQLVRMAIMLTLLIVSARLVIPLPLLDYISLQIVIIYLIFPILGLKKGLMVSIVYLIVGLLGVPIFAAGGGIYYVFKPTFGFLLAFSLFPLIQYSIRKIPIKMNETFKIFCSNYAALIVIHFAGILYKFFILNITMDGNLYQVSAILTISTIIDFASDIFLVTLASIMELTIKNLNFCLAKN